MRESFSLRNKQFPGANRMRTEIPQCSTTDIALRICRCGAALATTHQAVVVLVDSRVNGFKCSCYPVPGLKQRVGHSEQCLRYHVTVKCLVVANSYPFLAFVISVKNGMVIIAC